MTNASVIGATPDRSNIKYSVIHNQTTAGLCSSLAEEISLLRLATPKTVVFCKTLKQAGELHLKLKVLLGKDMTEPPGLPAVLPFRIVHLFTSASRAELREDILHEFCKNNSTLRILIATTAFGLGVDCHCISRVINWGAPHSLEELVQESGRAGRDGSNAEAILYHIGGRYYTKEIQQYVENQSTCRRNVLFKNFLFSDTHKDNIVACRCCDLCGSMCTCVSCINK